MSGRGIWQPDIYKTQTYLVEKIQSTGAQSPPGFDSFKQSIPMHISHPLPTSQLQLNIEGETLNLKLTDDYVLLEGGPSTLIPDMRQLVFVGYGIIAPEYDYNDYQSLDVVGKIVCFLDGEPFSKNPDYFDGTLKTAYSHVETKRRIAVSRGAAGSILIPNIQPDEWDFYKAEFQFPLIQLAYQPTTHFSAVLHPRLTEKIFSSTPQNLQALFIQSFISGFYLPSKLSFKGQFKERDFISYNIGALIPGSDDKLKETVVVVTSHYDHLGIGPIVMGDSIYNGAFDNAIGNAVTLSILEQLMAMNSQPKRSLLFLFTTGEEFGLLGAKYYLDHPSFPLYKTVANVNIDGLNMYGKTKDYFGIGASLSTLEQELKRILYHQDLSYGDIDPDYLLSEHFNRSDHFEFAKEGIPSILIQEGFRFEQFNEETARELKKNWMEVIYHSPIDDIHQFYQWDGVLQHGDITQQFIWELANLRLEPQWESGTIFGLRRLQNRAEKR